MLTLCGIKLLRLTTKQMSVNMIGKKLNTYGMTNLRNGYQVQFKLSKIQFKI